MLHLPTFSCHLPLDHHQRCECNRLGVFVTVVTDMFVVVVVCVLLLLLTLFLQPLIMLCFVFVQISTCQFLVKVLVKIWSTCQQFGVVVTVKVS